MVSGVVVNECLYWDVIKSNDTNGDIYKVIILLFHMGEKTFQEIEFSIYHKEGAIDLSRCLGEFRGKLEIFTFYPIENWFGPENNLVTFG